MTALDFACKNNHQDIAELILEKKVNSVAKFFDKFKATADST